jgi:hypothetical protein
MRDAALLAVWIIGLFTLIGGVMAAVVRFVNKDTSAYDKQLTWAHFPQAQDRPPEGTSETVQEDRRG